VALQVVSNLNTRNLHWEEVLAGTGVKEGAVLGWGQASILSMHDDLECDLDGVLPCSNPDAEL
jgi:hypothetical protein